MLHTNLTLFLETIGLICILTIIVCMRILLLMKRKVTYVAQIFGLCTWAQKVGARILKQTRVV